MPGVDKRAVTVEEAAQRWARTATRIPDSRGFLVAVAAARGAHRHGGTAAPPPDSPAAAPPAAAGRERRKRGQGPPPWPATPRPAGSPRPPPPLQRGPAGQGRGGGGGWGWGARICASFCLPNWRRFGRAARNTGGPGHGTCSDARRQAIRPSLSAAPSSSSASAAACFRPFSMTAANTAAAACRRGRRETRGHQRGVGRGMAGKSAGRAAGLPCHRAPVRGSLSPCRRTASRITHLHRRLGGAHRAAVWVRHKLHPCLQQQLGGLGIPVVGVGHAVR